MDPFLPELLAPAGGLEKLKTAVLYGADAVYFAGQEYGLRAAADNFTWEEVREGVAFAHARGAKAYVVLNGFLHDDDLETLPAFVRVLKEAAVDAVIVSDPGVARVVRENGPLPLHVSTQASVLNAAAALAWKELGAVRVVLGREVSVEEAARIQREAGVEVEMFVHGALCMSYSGHCVISNFTQGRDSNRGGCAHSCRHGYDVGFADGKRQSAYFMSSKDLEGLPALPEFVRAGIVSLKVEGRMKGPLYAATTTRVYRMALDHYKCHGSWENAPWQLWEEELRKLPHRSHTTAGLMGPAGADSVFDEREHADAEWGLAGTVLAATPEKGILFECRQSFGAGAQVEALPFRGAVLPLTLAGMAGPDFAPLERTRPSSLVRLPYVPGVEVGQVLRVRQQRNEVTCAP